MNQYLTVNLLHVIAVELIIGGMFASLWVEGKSMIVEGAIDYALGQSA